MENNKQPKPDPKGKAVASLVFACIGIVIQIYLIQSINSWVAKTGEGAFGAMGFLISSPIPFLFGLIGLILGIKGLKSTRRNLAIAGIVFSIISIIFPIFTIMPLLVALLI